MNIRRAFYIVVIGTLMTFSLPLKAQMSVQFCAGMDDQGNPFNVSNAFEMSRLGGYIYFLVIAPEGKTLNTHKIKFLIYPVNNSDTVSVTIDVEPEWKWCWKEATFRRAGEYIVNVYDMDWYNPVENKRGHLMGSGEVTIKYVDK